MKDKKKLGEIDFEDLDEIRNDFMVRIFSYVFRNLQDKIKLNASKLLYLFNVDGRKDRAKDTSYYPAFYTEEGKPIYIKQEKEKRTQKKREYEIFDEMRINLRRSLSDEKWKLIEDLKEDDIHNKLRKMVRRNILEKKKGGSSGKKDYYYFELDDFKFSLFEDMVTKDYHKDKLEKYDLGEIERIDDNHTIYGIDPQKYDSVQNLKEKMKFLVSKQKLEIEEEVNKRKETVIKGEYKNQLGEVDSEKLNRLLSKFDSEIFRGFYFNFKSITDIYTTLLLKEKIIKQDKIDKKFLIDRLKRRYFRLTFSDIFKLCEDIKKFKEAPKEEIVEMYLPLKIKNNSNSLGDQVGELIDEGYAFEEARKEIEDDKKRTDILDVDREEIEEILEEKKFEYKDIKGFELELLSDNYIFQKNETYYLNKDDDIIDGVVKNYVGEENKIYWTKNDIREEEGFEITIPDPLFEEITDLSEKEKEKLKDFEIEVLKNVIDELIALDKSKKNFFLVQTGNSFSDEITDKLKIACEGSELSFLGDKVLLSFLSEYEGEENRTRILHASPKLYSYLQKQKERSRPLIFNFFLDGPLEDNGKLYEALLDVDSRKKGVLKNILDENLLKEI